MGPHVRISVRSGWPLLALFFLLLGAVFLQGAIWLILLVFLGGLYAASYFWIRYLATYVTVRRTLRSRLVSAGDRLEERFELINRGGIPIIWVEIADHSNVPGYNASVARGVGGEPVTRWLFSARCRQRGHFQVGPWEWMTGDPFGLFTAVLSFPIVDEVVIHPPIHTELPVQLPAGRRADGLRSREKSLRATINSAGVRDYRPLDPLPWIHWPTTARRGALHVRQFDLDAAGDIWIMLDFSRESQLGSGLDGTEEHAVLLAASLGAVAKTNNRPAGLAVYSREPLILPPGLGENQQWKMLQALAFLRADGEVGLEKSLPDIARAARRGTAVVLITADLSGAWLPKLDHLRRKGIALTAVLFERKTFGGSGQAGLLAREIVGLGFDAHIIRQGEVGRPILPERAEEIVYRVTPLGKVVAVRVGADG